MCRSYRCTISAVWVALDVRYREMILRVVPALGEQVYRLSAGVRQGEEIDRASLAASFTKAVSDSLVPRAMQAAKELGHDKIVVAGGVAANSRIRADFKAAAEKNGFKLYIPPLKLCGDNGAMVGAQAYYEYLAGVRAGSDLNAYATMEL